jgi:hypothetical protein
MSFGKCKHAETIENEIADFSALNLSPLISQMSLATSAHASASITESSVDDCQSISLNSDWPDNEGSSYYWNLWCCNSEWEQNSCTSSLSSRAR